MIFTTMVGYVRTTSGDIEIESRMVVVHWFLTRTVRGGFPSIPIARNDFYYTRVYKILGISIFFFGWMLY